MKNRNHQFALALCAGLALTGLARAEDGWSGQASLGYLASDGNSETTNLNAGLGLAYGVGRWTHALDLLAIGASEAKATTAERYEAGFKSEYLLTQRSYAFGALDWDKDLFGGVRERTAETVGLGYKLLDTPVHKLNTEIGVGARQLDNADGSSDNSAIGRFGGNYLWQFSPTAKFRQGLLLESGSDNTYGESVTALEASLTTTLSLAISYTLKHNSFVPNATPAIKHTDSYTAISLNYAF